MAQCKTPPPHAYLDSSVSVFSSPFSWPLLLLLPLLAGLFSDMGPTWLMLEGGKRQPGLGASCQAGTRTLRMASLHFRQHWVVSLHGCLSHSLDVPGCQLQAGESLGEVSWGWGLRREV